MLAVPQLAGGFEYQGWHTVQPDDATGRDGQAALVFHGANQRRLQDQGDKVFLRDQSNALAVVVKR